MNAAIMRESVKKITPKFVIILAAVFLALGLIQQQKDMTFAEVFPGDLSAVTHCSVQDESESETPRGRELTIQESRTLIDLLGELEYRTNGTADSLRFCYCRVFLSTGFDSVELMLTDDMVLVIPSDAEAKSQVYLVKPDTKDIQTYIESLFPAGY